MIPRPPFVMHASIDTNVVINTQMTNKAKAKILLIFDEFETDDQHWLHIPFCVVPSEDCSIWKIGSFPNRK